MDTQIYINMSGYSVSVRDYDGNVIGSLYNREAYSLIGGEGSFNCIGFLGPEGVYIYGYINEVDNNVFTGVSAYPYGKQQFEDDSYNLFNFFLMRSDQEIYDANGTYWGSVAAGRLVACKESLGDTGGNSMPWLKAINRVQNSNGEWIEIITDENRRYGYVDTGLRSGSSPTSIAMYGSW